MSDTEDRRLVGLLRCAKEDEPDSLPVSTGKEQRANLNAEDDQTAWEAGREPCWACGSRGCEHCGHTGFRLNHAANREPVGPFPPEPAFQSPEAVANAAEALRFLPNTSKLIGLLTERLALEALDRADDRKAHLTSAPPWSAKGSPSPTPAIPAGTCPNSRPLAVSAAGSGPARSRNQNYTAEGR